MDHKVQPNIVLVLIDTLRADHLSCYGHARRTSPSIDRIAERGTLFECAVSSAAWTPPAHASLFTGTYPSRHGVELSRLVLNPALDPLPEVLHRHGYRTYGVSSNHWLSRETRFDRGFDQFVHSWQLVQMAGTNHPLRRQQSKNELASDALAGDAAPAGLGYAFASRLNALYEDATKRLRQRLHAYDDGAWRVNHLVKRWVGEWSRAERPFFAFLHYMEPHIRYNAPGRFHRMHVPSGIGEQRVRRVNQDPWRFLSGRAPMDEEDFAILSGLYDGEVSYVDERVGQVFEMLRSAGLLERTLVIVTSDHGENLGDHGLMSHSYCLYDSLLRVPLILCHPGEFPAGERVGQQVQTLDLFSTILALAGVRDEKASEQNQGEPLFAADVHSRGDRLAYSEYLEPEPAMAQLRRRFPEFEPRPYDRALRSARTRELKYVWASDGRDELYDLVKDPGETSNRIEAEPERAAHLRSALESWTSSFDHATHDPEGRDTIEIDDDMRRRLEDLGYLA